MRALTFTSRSEFCRPWQMGALQLRCRGKGVQKLHSCAHSHGRQQRKLLAHHHLGRAVVLVAGCNISIALTKGPCDGKVASLGCTVQRSVALRILLVDRDANVHKGAAQIVAASFGGALVQEGALRAMQHTCMQLAMQEDQQTSST